MDNFKGSLQTYLTRAGLPMARYSSVQSGPQHAPTFMGRCKIGTDTYEAHTIEYSKVAAEQSAAGVALRCLLVCNQPKLPGEQGPPTNAQFDTPVMYDKRVKSAEKSAKHGARELDCPMTSNMRMPDTSEASASSVSVDSQVPAQDVFHEHYTLSGDDIGQHAVFILLDGENIQFSSVLEHPEAAAFVKHNARVWMFAQQDHPAHRAIPQVQMRLANALNAGYSHVFRPHRCFAVGSTGKDATDMAIVIVAARLLGFSRVKRVIILSGDNFARTGQHVLSQFYDGSKVFFASTVSDAARCLAQ